MQKEHDTGSNFQMINCGFFIEGQDEELGGSMKHKSTFRVEGDSFYGSAIVTYLKEDIPNSG